MRLKLNKEAKRTLGIASKVRAAFVRAGIVGYLSLQAISVIAAEPDILLNTSAGNEYSSYFNSAEYLEEKLKRLEAEEKEMNARHESELLERQQINMPPMDEKTLAKIPSISPDVARNIMEIIYAYDDKAHSGVYYFSNAERNETAERIRSMEFSPEDEKVIDGLRKELEVIFKNSDFFNEIYAFLVREDFYENLAEMLTIPSSDMPMASRGRNNKDANAIFFRGRSYLRSGKYDIADIIRAIVHEALHSNEGDEKRIEFMSKGVIGYNNRSEYLGLVEYDALPIMLMHFYNSGMPKEEFFDAYDNLDSRKNYAHGWKYGEELNAIADQLESFGKYFGIYTNITHEDFKDTIDYLKLFEAELINRSEYMDIQKAFEAALDGEVSSLEEHLKEYRKAFKNEAVVQDKIAALRPTLRDFATRRDLLSTAFGLGLIGAVSIAATSGNRRYKRAQKHGNQHGLIRGALYSKFSLSDKAKRQNIAFERNPAWYTSYANKVDIQLLAIHKMSHWAKERLLLDMDINSYKTPTEAYDAIRESITTYIKNENDLIKDFANYVMREQLELARQLDKKEFHNVQKQARKIPAFKR